MLRVLLLIFALVGCRITGQEEGYCADCPPTNNDGGEDGSTSGCKSSNECTLATKSQCENGNCVACKVNSDCDHISGKNVCYEGICVECTIEEEDAQCGKKSCNPLTKKCTSTDQESVGVCEECVADSECETGHRCVTLRFDGNERNVNHCLKEFPGCSEPYTVVLTDRESVSVPSEKSTYCGINEDKTTCEAIRDLDGNSKCGSGVTEEDPPGVPEKCGAEGLADGLCEQVNGVDYRCTYECGTSNECPGTIQCNTAGSIKYCGAAP